MKMSLRARITVMFVATVLGVGLALIALVYAYLKLTPVPFLAHIPASDDGLVIDGAVPITDEILRRVLLASVAGLAMLTAVAGLIGWFVAGLVIRPLREIARDAAIVTRGDLGARISHLGPADEVGELAATLNAMLDELSGALERQRRFASNASHELKTPVATIQTMADVALAGGDEASLRETLGRVREVNARAAETIAALLQLANVDVRDRQEMDLATLCRDITHAQGVPVTAEPVTVVASPTLMRQAVENLVRNGITHGEDPSLTLAKVSRNAEIIVESGGPVLDAAEIRTWIEPFARAQRTAGAGHGLGLALVDAIARAHGGSLDLTPRAGGGLAATLRLPAEASSGASRWADGRNMGSGRDQPRVTIRHVRRQDSSEGSVVRDVPVTNPRELRRRALRVVAEVRDDRPSEHLATTVAACMLGIGWPETVRARGSVGAGRPARPAPSGDRRAAGEQAPEAGERGCGGRTRS